jgi:hypothetical protein
VVVVVVVEEVVVLAAVEHGHVDMNQEVVVVEVEVVLVGEV